MTLFLHCKMHPKVCCFVQKVVKVVKVGLKVTDLCRFYSESDVVIVSTFQPLSLSFS